MKDRPQRRNHKKRSKLIYSIPLIIVVIAVGAWWLSRGTSSDTLPQESVQQNPQQTDANPNRIRIIAGGDIVAHDSVNENAKQSDGSYDYYSMVDRLQPIFDSADIKFCNQVTPAGGEEFGIRGYPEFNAPTELIRDLGKLGCNAVNMASNHSFDHSQEAISANVAAWKDVPGVLAAVGQNRTAAERDTVHVFEQKGVKIALLAYTTYINSNAPATNDYGVNLYSREFAASQIAEAKSEGAEIIITSMRWGTEYSPEVNEAQRREAQYLADQGVQLILGHGPHVLQPVDTITGSDGNETLVWYSLGNFLNTQLEAEALFNGLAVVDFDIETKKITNTGYLPVYMHYAWSAEDAKNENLLARTNLELFTLEDTTAELLAQQQLQTTIDAQRSRIQNVLNSAMTMRLVTESALTE